MLIQTIEELRLYFPAHALDTVEGMTGFIDNSEHDFLMEKLGSELYERLCEYYGTVYSDEYLESIGKSEKLSPMMQLLQMAQRVVVYDAFARAISVHAVSINESGINTAVADDYQKADQQAIQDFKQTCQKEAHSAVNRLLQTLEEWCVEMEGGGDESSEGSESSEGDESPAVVDTYSLGDESSEGETELTMAEIVALWKKSRFFYLAASLIMPSAKVLQEYLNIYDSREKFIMMLPDLRYVQEENIEELLGEDFLQYLIKQSYSADASKSDLRAIHKARKTVAALLEERTSVLKTSKERRQEAHNEAKRFMDKLVEWCDVHQKEFPTEAIKNAPFYKGDSSGEDSPKQEPWKNNHKRNRMFVTDSLL